MRARNVVLWIGAAVVVGVVGVVGTKVVVREVGYGTEFAETDTSITVDAGDRFSIVVRDNASIGDDWSVRSQPDEAVVTPEGDVHVSEGGSGTGGGGKRYFTFTARKAGTGEVELFNCSRCGTAPESKDSRAVTFQITVR